MFLVVLLSFSLQNLQSSNCCASMNFNFMRMKQICILKFVLYIKLNIPTTRRSPKAELVAKDGASALTSHLYRPVVLCTRLVSVLKKTILLISCKYINWISSCRNLHLFWIWLVLVYIYTFAYIHCHWMVVLW